MVVKRAIWIYWKEESVLPNLYDDAISTDPGLDMRAATRARQSDWLCEF